MLKAGVVETGELGPDGTMTAKLSQPAPTIAELAPNFPQLEILECLGRGGMGAVYKARQPKLDRFVALKVLSRKREGGPSDAEFAERFLREARALARLNHPDIVAVHDFGEGGGYHYLLMEFVDGLTLRQLLQTKRLSPEEALAVVPRICEALQFAHDHGIVHRDIKPENILLDKQGRVKIADFGIAKIVGVVPECASLTGAKDVLGTPHYMAPEQVEKPATVDHRADIFSLGVVFYEMLTGELPLGKFQPPSRKVQVDVRLDEVVLHALEKEPERRYQHASEVKTDIERIAATAEAPGNRQEASSEAKDAIWLSTNPLPDLLSGERVVHFERRLGLLFCKSLPTYRYFFSLPPLWSAGMYVTDRRVLFITHFFGLAQRFSLWFPGKAADTQREMLRRVSLGRSGVLGPFVQLDSEDYRTRWYRGLNLLLRLHLSNAETLHEIILAAQAGAVAIPTAEAKARPSARAANESASGTMLALRWGARVLGSIWVMIALIFLIGEGSPPIGQQPVAVQLEFVAMALMVAGCVMGWWRERAAALLALGGWILFHAAELRVELLSLFHVPLMAGILYAFSWNARQAALRTAKIDWIAPVAVPVLVALLINTGMPASAQRRVSRETSRPKLAVTPVAFDAVRAVALFNEIEDFGHEFDAAFTSTNLAAAQTGTRRLLSLLTNFNAVVTGTDLTFPAGIFRDVAKVRDALDTGNWNHARQLARHNTEYAQAFKQISARMVELARQQAATGTIVLSAANQPVPPVVIQTLPESGAADVDPALTELRVTFSKPMRDRSWSWTLWGEENFPELAGQPRYLADGRTCVLPVKLKPGKLYATWLNSEYHKDFTDSNGLPAVPYLLIFQTRN